MLLCFILPHSQRGHLPISLLIIQTHWVPCFRRGVSTNIPWTWWIWRSSLHKPVRFQPSLLRHKSTKNTSFHDPGTQTSHVTYARWTLITPKRTLPCNHWFYGLGHNFVWLIVLDTRSCGTSLHTYVTTHCIPTQVCRNVFQLFGRKKLTLCCPLFGTEHKIHFVVISPTCAVMLVSLILWG